MNWTEIQELAAGHALGALDSTDLRRLETLLAQHPEARAELAAFCEVAIALALVWNAPVRPPPSLRAKVLARVAGLPPDKPASCPAPIPTGSRFGMNGTVVLATTPGPGFRRRVLSGSRDAGACVVTGERVSGAKQTGHSLEASTGNHQEFVSTANLQ